jgi:hypothetical protein
MDLTALAHEVIAASVSADPETIAKSLYVRIPAEQTADALQQALLPFVREMLGRDRMDSARTENAAPTRTAAPGPSRKAALRVASWEKKLHVSYSVGGGQHYWLRDMGPAECRAAARIRFSQAAATQNRGQWLLGLASAQEQHGVDSVGQLPKSVLADLLGPDTAAA